MHARRTTILGLAAGCLATYLLGCLFPTAPPSRTNNQGGGSLLTATGKIAAGQMTQLNADEIQILTDTISQQSPDINLTLSDEQAQAIVDFLNDNNLNGPEDFANFDPTTAQIPEGAEELFGNVEQFDAGG